MSRITLTTVDMYQSEYWVNQSTIRVVSRSVFSEILENTPNVPVIRLKLGKRSKMIIFWSLSTIFELSCIFGGCRGIRKLAQT